MINKYYRAAIWRTQLRIRGWTIILLVYPFWLAAQSPELILVKAADSILQEVVGSGALSGAVLSIKQRGKTVLCKAYGYARLYSHPPQRLSPPELMTIGHLFDLASLTKVVGTTTGIMLLVDQKKISLEDAVGKYIPAFQAPDKICITIRHLLTHTSGLADWYPLYYFASTRQEVYQLISRLPLKYPVGEGRHYSDLGFTILGQIIETVSRQPLEVFFQECIGGPLGLSHTLYKPQEINKSWPYAATSWGNPYEKRMVYDSTLGFKVPGLDVESWQGWRNYVLAGEVNDGNAWYAGQGVSGAAGLFSTITDLQLFMDFILRPDKKNFISSALVRQFLTADKYKNGLGWMMDPANSFMKNAPPGTFGHTGFTGTSLVAIPSADLSMILLTNRQQTGLNGQGDYYQVGPLRENLFQAILRYLKA